MNAQLFKQLLVSIAALTAVACASTTDGLEIKNRKQPAAVASQGHHDADGAKIDHTSCQCPPASCSTGSERGGVSKCQMKDGMMSHHTPSPAEPVAQK